MAGELSIKFLVDSATLKKGLNNSKNQLSGFEKATKKITGGIGKALGGFGIALGASALVSGLKEATKAAAEDIKQQKLLAGQLQRTTGATEAQVKGAESFIDTLSKQTGILDDDLRPALANAVRGSGSLAKGQELLQVALDGSVASGKPLDTVLNALIKANNGNKQSLYRLAPELKKTSGNIDDYAKSVKGAAEAGADPFAKFNVAVENLTESIGRKLLPFAEKFVDYLSKNVIPEVENFIDQASNPKTEIGKTFQAIGDAVKKVFNDVKGFFALFGNGDAAKGFATVATSLVKALPALLALKGILTLAAAGKSLSALVAAIAALRGAPGGTAIAGGKGGKGTTPLLGVNPATLVAAGVLTLGGDTQKDKPLVPQIPKVANSVTFGQSPILGKVGGLTLNDLNKIRASSYTININGSKMTPNEIVAAIKQYERQTGVKP